MKSPSAKRARLQKPNVSAPVQAALECCAARCVDVVPPDETAFETANPAIRMPCALQSNSTSWYNESNLNAAVATGLAARQVVETLNALAHCKGYDPETEPAFWRTQLKQTVLSPHQLHVITDETLCTFRVECAFENLQADPQQLARALAAAISPFPESTAMVMRETVLANFASFLEFRRVPCELTTTLVVQLTSNQRGYRDDQGQYMMRSFSLVRATLFYLNRHWNAELEKLPACERKKERYKIRVEIHSRMADYLSVDACASLVEVLALDHVAITGLVGLQISDSHGVFTEALRRLMRALGHADSLRVLKVQVGASTDGVVAAVCSVLPRMCALESCTISAMSCAGYPPSFYYWIYYVITARARRGLAPLAMGFQATRVARSQILAAKRSDCALGPCLLERRVCKLQPDGTTAQLPVGAVLTAVNEALLSDSSTRAERITFHVDPDSVVVDCVDVVALIESQAIVVVPAIGLMAIDSALLSAWCTPTADTISSGPCLQHVCVNESDVGHAVDMIDTLGAGLTQCCLSNCRGSVSCELMAGILDACPRLQKLGFVQTAVDSFEPLVAGYTTARTCQIRTLVFSSSKGNDAHATALFQTLAYGLRELTMSVSAGTNALQELVKQLKDNRTFSYLSSGVSYAGRDDPNVRRLEAFTSMPVGQSRRSKAAAYQFLCIAQRHAYLQMLPLEWKQAIVAFAATGMPRFVSMGS